MIGFCLLYLGKKAAYYLNAELVKDLLHMFSEFGALSDCQGADFKGQYVSWCDEQETEHSDLVSE